MAITLITPTKVKRVETGVSYVAPATLGALDSSSPAYIATYGTYGAKVPFEKKMQHYALLIENTASTSANVLVHANHHEFFVDEPLTISVAASSSAVLQLDTGRHVLLSGADKGYAYVVGAADTIKVALIELP